MDVEHRQLGEQRLADQLAERADDARARARRRAIRSTASSPVDALGLDAARARARALASATGGGRRPTPPPRGAVRRGDHEGGPVGRVRKAPQHRAPRTPRCPGRRSSRESTRPVASSRLVVGRVGYVCPRAARRSAALRCSLVVRSSISTPSRWSISCWRTRASRPEASTSSGSPLDVDAADPRVAAAARRRPRPAAG